VTSAAPVEASTSATTTLPVSNAAVPVTTEGACTFGAWQCSGLALQVCAYQDSTTVAWETVATCDSECSFTSTGSVLCQ
jgi:hypothetical protein